VARRIIEEEETVAGQKIYRTPEGWHVAGLLTPPVGHDIAVTLAELLTENPYLAQINARIVGHGGKPIPPRRVSEQAIQQTRPKASWPESVKPDR
jgi:hypothetical protein